MSASLSLTGNTSVSQDMTRPVGRDHLRIRLDQDHEVRYWAAKFGVTPQTLHEAVADVGMWSDDVAHRLGTHSP